MKPRLPSSKKWTAFPAEFTEQIQAVFGESFPEQAKVGKFLIEGQIFPEEVLFRAGYLENGRLKQMNFECSITCSAKDLDATEKIMNCVDAVAAMMNDYFESLKTEEEIEFPLKWTEFVIEGQKVFLQTSTVNTALEQEADRLLGQTFEEMVHEDEMNEDALEVAEIMATDEIPKKEDMH
jgi:hypothetical protein